MVKYWNWGGRYIGVRQNDYLVACDGTILGKFYGKEIYDPGGKYIGELGRHDRLMKNRTKEDFCRPAFSSAMRGTVTQPFKDCAPYPVMPGVEEFLK